MPKRTHAETSPPPPEIEGHLTVHVYPDGIDRIYMWQATPAQSVASHTLYNKIFPALQALDAELKAPAGPAKPSRR